MSVPEKATAPREAGISRRAYNVCLSGKRILSQPAVASSLKSTSIPILPICQFGQCRRQLLRLVTHVISQNGVAIQICQRCFVEITLREASAVVRARFDAEFNYRPRFIRTGGASLAILPAAPPE